MPEIREFRVTPWLQLSHVDGSTTTHGDISGSVPVSLTGEVMCLVITAKQQATGQGFEVQFDGDDLDAIVAAGTAPTLSVTTTNTSTTVTAVSTATLRAGMSITGTGIPGGATVASIQSGTSFTLSAAATASGTVTATIAFPGKSLTTSTLRAPSSSGTYSHLRYVQIHAYGENGAAVPCDITVGGATGSGILPDRCSGVLMMGFNDYPYVLDGTQDIKVLTDHVSGPATVEMRLVFALPE